MACESAGQKGEERERERKKRSSLIPFCLYKPWAENQNLRQTDGQTDGGREGRTLGLLQLHQIRASASGSQRIRPAQLLLDSPPPSGSPPPPPRAPPPLSGGPTGHLRANRTDFLNHSESYPSEMDLDDFRRGKRREELAERNTRPRQVSPVQVTRAETL